MSIATPLVIQREVDAYVAMAHGRQIATALGFNEVDRTKIGIIILELARNMLHHAQTGELLIEPIRQAAQHGVVITARDTGPGIANIQRALEDGFSTAGTLGAGLPGVQRLADQFEIDTHPGVGTTVRAWKWLGPTKGNPYA